MNGKREKAVPQENAVTANKESELPAELSPVFLSQVKAMFEEGIDPASLAKDAALRERIGKQVDKLNTIWELMRSGKYDYIESEDYGFKQWFSKMATASPEEIGKEVQSGDFSHYVRTAIVKLDFMKSQASEVFLDPLLSKEDLKEITGSPHDISAIYEELLRGTIDNLRDENTAEEKEYENSSSELFSQKIDLQSKELDGKLDPATLEEYIERFSEVHAIPGWLSKVLAFGKYRTQRNEVSKLNPAQKFVALNLVGKAHPDGFSEIESRYRLPREMLLRPISDYLNSLKREEERKAKEAARRKGHIT